MEKLHMSKSKYLNIKNRIVTNSKNENTKLSLKTYISNSTCTFFEKKIS